MKDRGPPLPVPPVVAGGIRYEAIEWGKARGLKQNGGYIVAIDDETEDELWLVKVYDVTYKGRSADKHDIFITAIELDQAGDKLQVENEAGQRFVVHLADRWVSSA